MILSLPFSHLPEILIAQLTAVVGPVSVLLPSGKMASVQMQAAADRGKLRLLAPEHVDPAQLDRAVKAFSQWAQLHHGRSGELTALFQAGRSAGLHETSAHRLRTLIKQYDGESADGAEDPIFQAALFLALAHDYDRQREALESELGAVRSLEKRFGDILGDLDSETVSLGRLTLQAASQNNEAGRHMVEQRLASWARLALPLAGATKALVTTSSHVWDHMMSLLPDAVTLWEGRAADSDRSGQPLSKCLNSLIETLAAADEPQQATLDRIVPEADGETGPILKVAVSGGHPLAALLKTFAGINQDGEGASQSRPSDRRNAVLLQIEF